MKFKGFYIQKYFVINSSSHQKGEGGDECKKYGRLLEKVKLGNSLLWLIELVEKEIVDILALLFS